MKRKLQKILMILTSCGLILTTAGCGTSQIADTDTITQNEEDTTGASGTTKEKDADTDTDSKKTAVTGDSDAENGTDDNTDEESGLAQTTDTAKTGTGVATSGTTGQKPAASGATATSGTTFQKPTASESSGTAGTTTSGTAATEATSGSGTSSAKDSSSGTSATSTEPTVIHIHEWTAVYKTIEHPEEGHYEQVLIGEEYTNPICEYHDVCNGCGFDYTANGVTPGDHICPNGHTGSWTTVRVITGYETVPAIYEDQWIVDRAAYSEQVVDYYRCSECGQTK